MLKFFKEYMPYYKEYKKEIFFAIIGMILVSFATAATAYLVKPVLDKIFIEKNEKMLYILPIVIIVLYFLKGVGYILQQYYVSYIGEDIVRKIRDKFLGHILKSDINFFKTTHSGELVSRIINDINRIQRAVSSDIAALMRDILMSIFLLGVVLYQNYKLAIFALIILPLIVYPINLIAQKLKKLSKKSQEKTANLNATLSEIFKNVETIKAYNAEDFEHKKFSKLNLEFLKVNLKSTKLNALVVPLMEFVSAVVAAIVIIVGGKLVIDGSMSVGEFFSFMTALFMMSDPLRKISVTYSKLQDAIAANERLKEIFNIKPSIKSGNEKLQNIETIEFKNVSLKYNDKYALKNINYFAKRPKIIGLVGDSGGGKSSFISLIERFYDTSNGEILINNKNIKNYSIKDLREKIAYIPQTIHIFNDTIAANIAYGREIDEEKVINALKQANLWEFVKKLPNGIYEILQENGSNLSGGQRQRIAIARALYKNPDILILDEATSALDRKSEEKVMESILNLKDKLIFIVAHRLSTIENADEILVFKEGKIVCKGNKEELLKNCEEFKKLYNN
ncbi:ABC transporter ATP-binding protein [Caminibacter mediatlanticus TB-2]|uniref:ABC transporter ATP-binding protein n=1 Tax=Caminibacter mediatlanticus TB-2 TaxID=391592 RepID=A0ABX5V926_9BACT|nr:ABC transporter ATP-binding protein [Caminibacter mediatlanticus]QCT93892.1 ABC transporter ATP-binding protein [Caminibacter mediatlanticus TB-2]